MMWFEVKLGLQSWVIVCVLLLYRNTGHGMNLSRVCPSSHPTTRTQEWTDGWMDGWTDKYSSQEFSSTGNVLFVPGVQLFSSPLNPSHLHPLNWAMQSNTENYFSRHSHIAHLLRKMCLWETGQLIMAEYQWGMTRHEAIAFMKNKVVFNVLVTRVLWF